MTITKEQLQDDELINAFLRERKDDEPELTWEQMNAIKLEIQGKLPELAKKHKEEGRRKYLERLTAELISEERGRKRLEEEAELKKKEKIQEEHTKSLKEPNEIYELRMEVISLLAKKERRLATELIVEHIKKDNHIYTTRDDIKSEMWIYRDGIYKQDGKTYITEECRKILKENFTVQITNEVLSKIEADTYINGEDFFKNDYINEIPVQNGILDILARRLIPFDPKKIFFNKLPIEYNPDAKCPFIDKHFSAILKKKEDKKVLYEIFGFFLYKDYFVEKAIMFVGDGRNGKGKTIDLMKRFLGTDNCCSVPLSILSDGGFRIWDLFGKMANLAGDLPSNALKNTAILKQTTGRDLIGADRKNKSTINFTNYAKHVFACNELPRVYDFSRGFWERWVLFEFPYTFINEDKYNELEDKGSYRLKDPFIIDKLTTKEELSGLLNEAIKGLYRILEQKDFSYSIGVDEVKKFWVRKSDSFTAFTMDNLEESYDENISKQRLRKVFSRYCKKHKIRGASDKNIKVVLEEMFGATDRQSSDGLRVWDGVKLKENSEFNFMEEKITGKT